MTKEFHQTETGIYMRQLWLKNLKAKRGLSRTMREAEQIERIHPACGLYHERVKAYLIVNKPVQPVTVFFCAVDRENRRVR